MLKLRKFFINCNLFKLFYSIDLGLDKMRGFKRSSQNLLVKYFIVSLFYVKFNPLYVSDSLSLTYKILLNNASKL